MVRVAGISLASTPWDKDANWAKAQRLIRRRLEWLPSHAPELNPVEQVWNHAKYTDLPNRAPENIDELEGLVPGSIAQTRKESQLLRSFFRTAKLKL